MISPLLAPTTQENTPSGVKRWTCSLMRQRITGWSFMTASLMVGIRNTCFQNDFASHVRNKLEYHEMLQKHREHRIFLNVNSVEDSLTMAARRIFEIPASGACLVSGPGLAVRQVFGNTVPIIHSSEQANATLDALMADEEFLRYTIKASRSMCLSNISTIIDYKKMLNASSFRPFNVLHQSQTQSS